MIYLNYIENNLNIIFKNIKNNESNIKFIYN